MKKNSRFSGIYLGIIFFLMYLPVVVVIIFSFNESKLPVRFSGFSLTWYQELFQDEDMLEACKLAQADEFIQQFPDKYDTWIEQGGSNVSGGQKQRLCIARALMKKPKVLILDDSTSAVDTRTDALIRQGFREFIPETTKIIIAQRVASVQDADRIIVMDGGRISAIGNHEELMKTSEIGRAHV